MPLSDEHKVATAGAFASPQVGDRFSEMFSFYVYVVDIRGDVVVTMEASPPCEFPNDGKIREQSAEDFRKRFAYGSIPGYWVTLLDRNNDVTGWCDAAPAGSEESEGK